MCIHEKSVLVRFLLQVRDVIFFLGTSPFNLPPDSYRNKVVSATSDGASVNMGKYNGVLTQLERDRPWLLKIHCVNHRIELAVKSAFDIKQFKDVDEFYSTNFYLAKRSGKIKAELAECAASLGITFYNLPKIHGTRFISHRRRGFKNLMEMWPAYILTYENVEADVQGHVATTRSKVSGLLKKFKSFQFMCYVQVYLDLLEDTVPLSMVFESDMLLAFEVPLAVRRTVMELQERIDDIGTDDEFLDSYLHRFNVSEDGKFKGEFVTAGDKRKRKQNRRYVTVQVTMNPFSFQECKEKVWNLKRSVIPSLIKLLQSRFKDYNNKIFEKMRWFDPQYWMNESDYGNEDLLEVAKHFEEPLAFASFNASKVLREWKSFKKYVRSYYTKLPDAHTLWKSVLCYRRDEFPNLAKIASVIISISGSNSSVERTFSVLTNILSDKRLSLTHKAMNENMIVYGNHKLWSKEEKDEIIERAVQIYLQSKRRKKVSQPAKCVSLGESSAEENVVLLTSSEDETESSSDDVDAVMMASSDNDSETEFPDQELELNSDSSPDLDQDEH